MLAAKVGYFRSSGFDPRSIANCTAWFDATKTSTITLNGSTVSSWANLVSGGSAYAQTTAALQPTQTTLAGLNAISFPSGNSATASRLDGPTLNAIADNTNNILFAFLVVQYTGTTNVTNRFFSNTSEWQASGFGWFPRYSNGQAYWDAPQSTARVNGVVTSTSINTGPTICRLTRNGATAAMHYNATQIATRSNASGAISANLGTATRLAGQDANNTIVCAEIITYSRSLSSTEIQTIERALGKKYGVSIP